jgi:hypothetical protein
VILTREDVKELQATGTAEVLLPKLPVKELQSVQVGVAKPSVCVVRVTDHWPHRSGGEVVVIELVKRLKPTKAPVRKGRERLRLMKRGHGSTTDPRGAMRDSEIQWDEEAGPAAEPEMVDEQTEMRFARRAHQNDELRELERNRRTLTERLDQTLEGAKRLGVDPTRHVAAIERRISDLEKKLRKAA